MTQAAPLPDLHPPRSLGSRLSLFAQDIKISHTIFAMPWALLSTFIAANGHPHVGQLLLILLCMITARTVAMAANRLLDAALDKENPRTARRAIPSGQLSRGFYTAMLGGCALAFIGGTSLFWFIYRNPLPLMLSIPVLGFISAYPLLKRFSRLCHYYLGAALALAPICAWIAITSSLDLTPFLMAAAVLLWTAGFDIIYACQDYQSDLETGVVSVPVRLGIPRALWLARLTHLLSFSAMVALGLYAAPLAKLYFIGVGLAGMLLIIEHALVSPADLSKVGMAFFTINGIISVILAALGIADLYL
jgi:4-hydroxybenzoate polyprenyltransferase